MCFFALGNDLLEFYYSSMSWKSLRTERAEKAKRVCVSLWADETVNKICCGSLNKGAALTFFSQDSESFGSWTCSLDIGLLSLGKLCIHFWFDFISWMLILSAINVFCLLFLCWHYTSITPHFFSQQLKSVVVLSSSLVWRSLHGKKDVVAK